MFFKVLNSFFLIMMMVDFGRYGFIFPMDTDKRFNIKNQNNQTIKIIKILQSSFLKSVENIMHFYLLFWTYKMDYCKPWFEKTYSAMVKPFRISLSRSLQLFKLLECYLKISNCKDALLEIISNLCIKQYVQ